MLSNNIELEKKAQQAKQAATSLAVLPTNIKNEALLKMADALEFEAEFILTENHKDIENGTQKGLRASLLDRLLLTKERITAMAEGLRQTVSLPDPVGEGLGATVRPNGLEIRKVRVPLGVIGIIYEARPNVTADAVGLCLKSGNAVILRGGSEAINSNIAIIKVLTTAAEKAGIPAGAIAFIENTDRQVVNEMLKLNQYLDVIIPRGGAGLIKTVVENSTVPVIETGTGVCHTFIDESADLNMALAIAINAKVSRPAVCNSMETLLIHEAVAKTFMPAVLKSLAEHKVEVRGCEKTYALDSNIKMASPEDWAKEYGDLILNIKIVTDINEAIAHIGKYSTRHSEAIITNDYNNSRKFQNEVDAAAVYVNASTRFTDGFEFGYGAEIGISTQKLHARGPMGLTELTSTKYVILGSGQIR